MKPKEVVAMLDDVDRARLRRSGRKPLIAAYRVAHEGVSTGPIAGFGRAAKRWSPPMVKELSDKLRGAPVYIGHASGAGPRRPVGHVLRSKDMDGPLGSEAVAVMVIEDPRAVEEVRAGKLDAASVEADLLLEPGDSEWKVSGVESVTGMALACAREQSPGFNRAALLACTHELDEDTLPENNSSPPVTMSREQAAREVMAGLNLTDGERSFVMKRIAERLSENDSQPEVVREEVGLAIATLDEAKRLYRRPPPQTPIPFERRRGPVNYADPEYNELIPRIQRR